VHGVLHLLGYDHAEPAEEREMFTLQRRILADFHTARDDATRRAAQRSADDKVLGAVGLDKTVGQDKAEPVAEPEPPSAPAETTESD
jgi:probable rRNA maturation factor